MHACSHNLCDRFERFEMLVAIGLPGACMVIAFEG